MKKISITLSLIALLSMPSVLAHPYYYNDYYRNSYYHNHYSSCHNCSYVVRSDTYQTQENFANCDKYTLLIDTTVNYYSNGSRRTYNIYSVLDKDGNVLISNCNDIKHVDYNKKHYFLAKKGKYYSIVQDNGVAWAQRKYTKMSEVAPNKILVMVDKKYGIIDINENIIVPIKYKEFNQVNSNLFITKLNGYYGIIDNSNNIFLKNQFDKITQVYDTFIAKKQGKYGLLSNDGKIILNPEYDKIKKLGEYIIVEKNNKYGLFDSTGQQLLETKYKKIRLKRNTIEAKLDKVWEELL